MAIPTFVSASLTALTIFVCFQSSRVALVVLKKKNSILMFSLQNNIVTFISHMAH